MKRSLVSSLVTASLAAAVAVAFVVGSAGLVHAQNKGKKPAKGAQERVKTYDFTGDTIDGDLVKPDGEFVDTRNFATHTSLITVRKDFIREIVKSAEDL